MQAGTSRPSSHLRSLFCLAIKSTQTDQIQTSLVESSERDSGSRTLGFAFASRQNGRSSRKQEPGALRQLGQRGVLASFWLGLWTK
jgi:hypothetical protein